MPKKKPAYVMEEEPPKLHGEGYERSDNDVRSAVKDIFDKTIPTLSSETTDEEYREYLNEAYRYQHSTVFHDIMRRIAEPFSDYIISEARTFDEVTAHRSVLIAVQEIKKLVRTLSNEYETILSEQDKIPSDIIPN